MHVTSKNLDYHVIGCCCYDNGSKRVPICKKKKKKGKKEKNTDENLQQVDMN